MNERTPRGICQMCGFYCIDNSNQSGRWFDLWDTVTYTSNRIEECEGRIAMTSEDPVPQDVARTLALLPGKLV